MFYKVQRNGCAICRDPPIPAFHFFARHKPHARKSRGTCKSIGPGNSAWRKILFKITERKKDRHIKRSKKQHFMQPFFFGAPHNTYYMLLLLVSFSPQNPPVNTHDGIVQIYTCLAEQTSFKTQVDIKNCIDKSGRINPDIFLSRKPYAHNS